jgi:lysocardiolipin and lysophospholipid acyltransferase
MPQMNTEGQRLRPQKTKPKLDIQNVAGDGSKAQGEHPMGPPQHGSFVQLLRIIGFGIYFFGIGMFINASQFLGTPLWVYNKDWYYAWMAMTKQYFGILITTMTYWWSPTIVRISGDKSVAGQLHQEADGSLRLEFPDRVVLIANHQIYTDWLYLWWSAYTNSPATHGHIYIILKAGLKYVPLIGPAMQFYGFVFMARKWATDQQRLRHRLQKLNSRHSGPLAGVQGAAQLDPMWLLIFPEGTNLSANTRKGSAKFAEKSGIPDLQHQILPRSTGLQFCLQELHNTVDYVYDCTIGYEGVPTGSYGQDIFGLRSVYFQGRPPKSVNMHWRRFAVKDIPIDDHDAMSEWVLARWREKDELLARFKETGKFPASVEAVDIAGGPKDSFKTAYISTEVKPKSPFEILQIFVPVLTAALIGRILVQIVDRLTGNY